MPRGWTGAALAAVALGLAVLLPGCRAAPADEPGTRHAATDHATARTPTNPGSETVVTPASTPTPPAVTRANELGQVPVLMYHQVLPHPHGIYDITPQAFRSELERLAKEGYVPVTAADYAAGRLDIPAGRHPVVLTFDDSTRTQLTLDGQGRPVPGTAVAVLLQVAARHPGFTATATFFVNRDPFGERGGRRYLGWLRAHGFEIGNHTLDHVSLGSMAPDRVRHQIAGDTAMIQRAVAGSKVTTLALPFGIRPRNRRVMLSGSGSGTSYRFGAALLVGAGPAPSPFSRDFNPAGVPRIRSQGRRGPEAGFGSARWLDRLAAHPRLRYTSDGDPATVSFPDGRADRLRRSDAVRARRY